LISAKYWTDRLKRTHVLQNDAVKKPEFRLLQSIVFSDFIFVLIMLVMSSDHVNPGLFKMNQINIYYFTLIKMELISQLELS
jgi:hypothetical protein